LQSIANSCNPVATHSHTPAGNGGFFYFAQNEHYFSCLTMFFGVFVENIADFFYFALSGVKKFLFFSFWCLQTMCIVC